MPDQNTTPTPQPEAALQIPTAPAGGQGSTASNATPTPIIDPTVKTAAVSALSGLDKKSFAEQILAQTEKLAEQVVQNPPAYGAGGDAHLIKDEKLKESAMQALEGDKWHEKRLEEEARQKLEDQKQQLLVEKESAKAEIEKLDREKEVFELQWVNLNDQKAPIDAELQTIINEETRLEGEEKKKEQEEIAAEKPEDRKVMEEARWQIQQERHATEEKKWATQDKVSTLMTAMQALSTKYQEILAQEDIRKRRIQEIDNDIKNL
ncbi:MAG: hypothetical protein WC764_02275 [Candidatus Paceibacterota bacterium]|jgi:hypothetical protein